MDGTGRLFAVCMVLSCLVVVLSCNGGAPPAIEIAVIHADTERPQVQFAATEIATALAEQGYAVDLAPLGPIPHPDTTPSVRIILARYVSAGLTGITLDSEPSPQGYAIRLLDEPRTVVVIGGDDRGVMYGGLRVAEAFAHGEEPAEEDHAPFIDGRGLALNLPLDARTPGFDDTGDSAWENIPTVWEYSFWESFLDGMARNRYNMLSLWHPHPFPHLVKLDNYPGAARDNVMRSPERSASGNPVSFDPHQDTHDVPGGSEVVKELTIDEKIEFWRTVMRHAEHRGIDVYMITGSSGEAGVPDDATYLRACTSTLLETYTTLAGIGIAESQAVSEPFGDSDSSRVPGFIHTIREDQLNTVMNEVETSRQESFTIGFASSQAHLYASTDPPFDDTLLPDMMRYNVRGWWHLRNNDVLTLRWGDPGYVREYLASLPPRAYTAGYHMGSDSYVWGREFTSHSPQTPRQREMDKHWLGFMLWGQLGYDNDLPDDHFRRAMDARLPESTGTPLFEALMTASKIIPLVNRFHWRGDNPRWLAEGCMDQAGEFQTVEDFIESTPLEGSGIMSIPEFVSDNQSGGITPLMVADQLDSLGSRVRDLHTELRRAMPNPSTEVRYTIADISATGYLGQYYAQKIRGAVALHQYRLSRDTVHRDEAVAHLEQALAYWGGYANLMYVLYDPPMLAGGRLLDWMALYQEAAEDIAIARGEFNIDRLLE